MGLLFMGVQGIWPGIVVLYRTAVSTITKNNQYELDTRFLISTGAAQTFHAKNNSIEWRIELTIAMNQLIKLQEKGVIEVEYS